MGRIIGMVLCLGILVVGLYWYFSPRSNPGEAKTIAHQQQESASSPPAEMVTLEGRLQDHLGLPLTDVSLVVLSYQASGQQPDFSWNQRGYLKTNRSAYQLNQLTSDREGEFRLDVSKGWDVDLVVDSPGLSRYVVRRFQRLVDDERVIVVNPEVSIGGGVNPEVFPDVRAVSMVDRKGFHFAVPLDEEGNFSATRLPAGRIEVWLEPRTPEAQPRIIETSASYHYEAWFGFDGLLRLEGEVVTEDGEAVGEGTVFLVSREHPQRFMGYELEREGAFLFERVRPGAYVLVYHRYPELVDQLSSSLAAHPKRMDLDLTEDREVRLVVQRSGGLKGLVQWEGAISARLRGDSGIVYRQPLADDGYLWIEGLVPDRYDVFLEQRDGQILAGGVSIGEGEIVVLETIEPQADAVLHVSIEGPLIEEVPTLMLLDTKTNQIVWRGRLEALRQQLLEHLPTGTFDVRALLPTGELLVQVSPATLTLTPAQDAKLTLRLTATTSLRVINRDPAQQFTRVMLTAEDRPRRSFQKVSALPTLESSNRPLTLFTEYEAMARHLPPGSYMLEVVGHLGGHFHKTIRLTKGQGFAIDVHF